MAAEALSWFEVTDEVPSLAGAVKSRFTAHPHHVLATVHADGRPRVNGTNVFFTEGHLWIGTMPNAARARDLDRFPWCALHSAPLDEKLGDGSGDARIEARAVRLEPVMAQHLLSVTNPGGDGPRSGEFFELLVHSMSLIEVDGDSLAIRIWTAGSDEQEIRRS
jgi:hypothetical protein